MKIRYLKLKNWLYITLAGLLGVNLSCTEDPMACEYGTPEATYRILGQVTDEEGMPIEGIQVEMYYGSKDTTDGNGAYYVSRRVIPPYDTMTVECCDIDGTVNGLYADTSVVVSFREAPYIGGDGDWYSGTATVVKNVELRKNNKILIL